MYSINWFLFLVFTIGLLACKKPTLVPKNDTRLIAVEYIDTLEIRTSIYRSDSIKSGGASSSLIGIINDSVFGITSAGTIISPLLSSTNVNFGNVVTLDSIVLSLQNVGFYGDAEAQIEIEVYELDEEITQENSEYYSNYSPSIKATPLFSGNVKLHRSDSVILGQGSDPQAPHVRLRLDDAFGQKILDYSGQTELTNNTEFVKAIKGLYIKPKQTVNSTLLNKGEGIIAYYNTSTGNLSQMTLYYNDSLSYKMTISSTSKRINTFKHNYLGTEIEKQLNNPMVADTNFFYIQPMAGVGAKIELPYLSAFKKRVGNIAINKAEFYLYADSTALYPPANSLFFTKIKTDGTIQFISDFSQGSNHYGGVYSKDLKGLYKLNVTLELQKILNDNTRDSALYLFPSSRAVRANRSVIKSQKNENRPAKILIHYTKI